MDNVLMQLDTVRTYLLGLQQNICTALESHETDLRFATDQWQREGGGGGMSKVLSNGVTFEKAGVNFSHIRGDKMPAAATARNQQLQGCAYQAMGVSLVVHPQNPMVPTSHMNVRFFLAEKPGQAPIWWFGGGFDLTPYYGFEEDAVHWHSTARDACKPLGDPAYQQYKKWCDDYFFLQHRNEARGIGGIFFDDLNEPDFETAFSFLKSVGDHYTLAYLPIVERRKKMDFSESQKQFQLYRRGRYVEFNLIYDRGTLFGLQSGGRVESILMSMPPLVRFDYDWQPQPESLEEQLYTNFLPAKNWLEQ